MEQLDDNSALYDRWFTAVAAGDLNTVLSLMSSGININTTNDKGQTAATVAEECGQKQVLHMLRQKGNRLSAEFPRGEVPAPTTARSVAHVPVEEKIRGGCDVNSCDQNGDNPLMVGVQKGSLHYVQKLHLARADLNFTRKDSYTPLLLACETGNVAIIKYLIENGSSINARRNDGWTPVMIATERSNYEIVELLIEHSAELDLGCNFGFTPIFVAVMRNDCSMAKLLLRKGCRTDIVDNRGLTALMHASWQCRVDIVRVICKYSSLVNVQNQNNGRTALHYAVLKDNIYVIRCLIDAKACLNVIDKLNKTPLNYARSPEVDELLTSHGAYLSSDQWYTSSRRQSMESCLSSSSVWSRTTVGDSSVTNFETVFHDGLNPSEKVNGTFVTTVTEEAATHLLRKPVPSMSQNSERLQELVPPLQIAEQPREVRGVEDVVLDKMELSGYLQRCAKYFLDHHVAGVSSSRASAHTEMDNRSNGKIHYLNQNININIENATYVQTGEGSRIIIREGSRESFVTGCDQDAISAFHRADLCGGEDSGLSTLDDFVGCRDEHFH